MSARASQAIPEEGAVPPTAATATETPATTAAAAATSTAGTPAEGEPAPKRRKGGRPAGSTNKKSRKAPASAEGDDDAADVPVAGTVEVHLQLRSKTAGGVYDFDREAHLTDVENVKVAAGIQIQDWFNGWRGKVQ